LIDRRCTSVEEVAAWARDVHAKGLQNKNIENLASSTQSTKSTPSTSSTFPEIAANAALVLIAVACGLLDRQIAAQARAFEIEGGFTERMYRRRVQKRKNR
jgi:four helix bundle suffix protein